MDPDAFIYGTNMFDIWALLPHDQEETISQQQYCTFHSLSNISIYFSLCFPLLYSIKISKREYGGIQCYKSDYC